MNREEFRFVMTQYCKFFPDFVRWLKEQSDPDFLKDTWFHVLEHTSKSDALDGIQLMVAGEAEHCPAYERSLVASYIKRAAKIISGKRYVHEEKEVGWRKNLEPLGVEGAMGKIGAKAAYIRIVSALDAACYEQGVNYLPRFERDTIIRREMEDLGL